MHVEYMRNGVPCYDRNSSSTADRLREIREAAATQTTDHHHDTESGGIDLWA